MEIDTSRIEIVTKFRVRDLQIEQTLMILRAEYYKGGGRVGRLYVESLENLLAVHILREYSTTQPGVAFYEGGLGARNYFNLNTLINAHLDRDIPLVDLAQLVGMSQFYFSHLFKQAMKSPHQY